MAVESEGNLLGMSLPARVAQDENGEQVSLREAGFSATLVCFVCNHCPYVRHIEHALGALAAQYLPAGLRTVAIVSNDFEAYPEDDVEGIAEQKLRAGWDFPYMVDRTQEIALEFGAVCTPDFFLFDRDFTLAYRGALDASSPKNGTPVTGDLMESAIVAVLANQPVPLPHRPAMGCGIKWLPGNEPESH